MFRWFVVVRVMSSFRTSRAKALIETFEAQNAACWHFKMQDLDGVVGDWGFSQPFRSEAAGRRYFGEFKAKDGEGSSIHLFLATAFTRRGAAKAALRAMLSPPGSAAELLDELRHLKR